MNTQRGAALYANTVPIVQSSGTGKSRMVDEAGKYKFTIPMCLRARGDDSGFPGANPDVRDWLSIQTGETRDRTEIRFILFLKYLFDAVCSELRNLLKNDNQEESLCMQWHAYFGEHKRKAVYRGVVQSLDSDWFRNNKTYVRWEVVEAAKKSLETLVDAITTAATYRQADSPGKPVVVFLSFDEAYEMTTDIRESSSGWSAYEILCNALSSLRKYPLCAAFLSTSPGLLKAPPTYQEWTSRNPNVGPDGVQPPFVELSFDTWKERVIIREDTMTLAEVCKLEFMVRFGRPLFWTRWEHGDTAVRQDLLMFAMAKLACNSLTSKRYNGTYDLSPDAIFAVLATRLDLEFEPFRGEAAHIEKKLIERHMRVLFSVPAHRESLCTGAPSEPLLAEAAAQLMQETQFRDVPGLVNRYMDDGLIGSGERGDLVARLLLTLAHDAAVMNAPARGGLLSAPVKVLDFFAAMVGEQHAGLIADSRPDNVPTSSGSGSQTFREAFANAHIHFTHWGKAVDDSLVSDKAAWFAMARGMGWQCVEQQYGIDIILPILLGDGDSAPLLGQYAMSAILIQIKTQQYDERAPIDADCDDLQFFTPAPEDKIRPYVVLVMDFWTPQTPHQGLSPSPAKGRRRASSDTNVLHPRYSIKISGCSNSVYAIIASTEDNSVYAQLLAPRTILRDHPSQDEDSQNAVLRMKPFWHAGEQSFGWSQSDAELGESSMSVTSTVSKIDSEDAGRIEVGIYRTEDEDNLV